MDLEQDFKEIFDILMRDVRKILDVDSESEDIVQEVLLRAIEKEKKDLALLRHMVKQKAIDRRSQAVREKGRTRQVREAEGEGSARRRRRGRRIPGAGTALLLDPDASADEGPSSDGPRAPGAGERAGRRSEDRITEGRWARG